MKKSIYITLALAGILSMNSCNDDEFLPGNPSMEIKAENADALFGDSLPFTIKASDVDVPLSTLKAQLFYGEEQVSETVIRTKTSGSDYTGKIYIPYYANIPNGKATLKYILQNIHFTTTEQETELTLARPDFPYLTLVDEEGQEYRMDRLIPFWNLLGRKLRHGRVPIYRNPNDKSIAFRRSSGFGFTVHQPGNRILRKFRMDLFSHTKAYSIISPLDLIKIFASRQPDISGE